MNTLFLFPLYIISIFICVPCFLIKNQSTIEILLFYVFQAAKVGRFLERVRESDIVKVIMKYLKTVPRCFFFKEHGGMYGTAGIPDIIVCIDGHFFGFEVKTDVGRPTKLQEAVIQKILAAGGTALVVRSVAEVKGVVENFYEQSTRMSLAVSSSVEGGAESGHD